MAATTMRIGHSRFSSTRHPLYRHSIPRLGCPVYRYHQKQRRFKTPCACTSAQQPHVQVEDDRVGSVPDYQHPSTINDDSFSLPPSSSQSAVQVFGLTHLSSDVSPAEWIWQHRPAAVVFETAVNPDHGAETGRVLSTASSEQAATDFRLRMFLQIAKQLSADTSQPLSESKVWQTVKQQLPGEQLAYIAALAIGAELVFGDRCKAITYQRLENMPSLAELDASYERLTIGNYEDVLMKHQPQNSNTLAGDKPAVAGAVAETDASADCIRTILTDERDLVLSCSIMKAAKQHGREAQVASVVGAAHMAGVFRHLQGSTMDSEAAGVKVLQSGEPADESPQQQGVRRALLTSCLALCCPPEVVKDCTVQLGDVSAAAQEAEQQATEIYGSTRMLLAVLSKEQLQKVCSGWRCNMHAVLQPVRDVRPLNGGAGVDEDVVWDHVRDLWLTIG